jgi:hypothetical protein
VPSISFKPVVIKLPDIIIVSVLTPFKALIILKICCEVITPPGVIPAVDIVPDGGVYTTGEAVVVVGVSDPESTLT